MNNFKIFVFFILFCFLPSTLTQANSNSNFKNYNNKLEIFNQEKNLIATFKVKIAIDAKTKKYGLMNLDYLPENFGMIFEFKKEQIIDMWMKNTKIPLDMIFVDKNNYIVDIFVNAKPYSLEIISSKKPANRVLEINGGLTQKLRIKVGDKINLQ